MQNHCFNILTFNHPQEELTLYITNVEDETLTRENQWSVSVSRWLPFLENLKPTAQKKMVEDFRTVRKLIDQVYQFSRMYWKSVRQQNLPITIKYPEIVAEMLPHFDGNEIPD